MQWGSIKRTWFCNLQVELGVLPSMWALITLYFEYNIAAAKRKNKEMIVLFFNIVKQ